MREIFCNNKIQILLEGETYFLRYETGQIASIINEITISDEEAQELMRMENSSDTFKFMLSQCKDRMLNARTILPPEYIGNTGQLY